MLLSAETDWARLFKRRKISHAATQYVIEQRQKDYSVCKNIYFPYWKAKTIHIKFTFTIIAFRHCFLIKWIYKWFQSWCSQPDVATITVWLTNRKLCLFVYCTEIRLLFHSIPHVRNAWHQYLLVQSTSLDSLNSLAINITTYCFKLNNGKQCTTLWWTDLCRMMAVEWNSCTGKINILCRIQFTHTDVMCYTRVLKAIYADRLALRMMACS